MGFPEPIPHPYPSDHEDLIRTPFVRKAAARPGRSEISPPERVVYGPNGHVVNNNEGAGATSSYLILETEIVFVVMVIIRLVAILLLRTSYFQLLHSFWIGL